jgi:hypothetical protein
MNLKMNEHLTSVEFFAGDPDRLERNGIRIRYEFDNGYGASIIRHQFSYGGDRGLWELAVTVGGEVYTDSPITDDVLGFLSEQDLIDALIKIKGLKL